MASIDDLAKEIAKQLEFYSQFVEEEVEEVAEEVSKEAVAKLKQKSPARSGDYAKGWRVKKVGKKLVIHNATHYQLTHLIEKGHATRDGGRTVAQEHIKPVEQETNREFEEKLIERLEG